MWTIFTRRSSSIRAWHAWWRLSGGYSQTDACAKLAKQHGMIASFSRALAEGLTKQMSDDAFNTKLGGSIDAIYAASVKKQ